MHGDQEEHHHAPVAAPGLTRRDSKVTVGRTVTRESACLRPCTLSRALRRGNPGGEMPRLSALSDADARQVGEGSLASAPQGSETGSTWGESATQPVPTETRGPVTARRPLEPPGQRLTTPTTTSSSCRADGRILVRQAADCPSVIWPIPRFHDETMTTVVAGRPRLGYPRRHGTH